MNSIQKSLEFINKIASPLKKAAYIPKTERCDIQNPRGSKFGGSAPYISRNGKLQTIFSLYIPSLPDEMQELFPKGHEYLLVGYIKDSTIFINLYTDSEIDSLKYGPTPSKENEFNEPRKVVCWEKKNAAK